MVLINVSDIEQLEITGLKEKLTKCRAFTYKSQTIHSVFIRIDPNQNEYDYNLLLLHEIGHIVLGHLDDNYLDINSNATSESEANAFVDKVLTYSVIRRYRNKIAFLIIIAAVISAILITAFFNVNNPTIDNEVIDSKFIRNVVEDDTDDYVYITVNGSKYHRENCIYAEDAMRIKREDAENQYDPCKFCNP